MARIDSNSDSCWGVSDGDVIHAEISCVNEVRIFTAHRNSPTDDVPCVHFDSAHLRQYADELHRLADRAEKGGG